MAGRPRVVATAEQREAVRALAGSSDREEADRARAILLSLEGWSSVRIAEAFSVKPDNVRHWRWTFGREGVSALRARKARLPKYAPELNDIEHAWRDLKRHFLAHQTFRDLDALDQAIHAAVLNLNTERQSAMCANLRIAA